MGQVIWSGILVFLESSNRCLTKLSLELIGKAQQLSAECGEKMYGIYIGAERSIIEQELKNYFFETIYYYEIKKKYLSTQYEGLVVQCIDSCTPSIVLVGGTVSGKAIASRVATHYKTGITADCTALSVDKNGNMIQTRPAFGGSIIADIITPVARPQFATIREGIFEKANKKYGVETKICTLEGDVIEDGIECVEIYMKKVEKRIEAERILIVVGNGIKKESDLYLLKELSMLLKGRLVSSRALVEKGWMSAKEQVGISGKTVKPDLLITCGVSGSIQFMEGIKQTPCIIAINSDRNANIFQIAHYSICGDLYEIVPKLIKTIERTVCK